MMWYPVFTTHLSHHHRVVVVVVFPDPSDYYYSLVMPVAAAAPVTNMPNICGVFIRELLAVDATTELDEKGTSQTDGLKNYGRTLNGYC